MVCLQNDKQKVKFIETNFTKTNFPWTVFLQ